MSVTTRVLLVVVLAAGLLSPVAGAEPGLRVTGPYAHLNLELFLFHGPQTVPAQRYLTLTEALARKLVVVHETGSVQELAIENKGRLPVFIQSGDIVKGGRQDRVLRSDMIVPPRSGRVPLASFCVESGRWTNRGSEDAGKFGSNTAMVPSKELKPAAKYSGSQNAVWSSVDEQQQRLNENLRRMKGDSSLDVRSGKSASSLQLTLESRELAEMAAEYKAKLAGLLEDRPEAIGFALVINGRLSAADLYGRRDLFRAMWPKLLDAAVVEAISEYKGPVEPATPGAAADALEAVRSAVALLSAGSGPATTRDPSARTRVVIREQGDRLVFETRDRALADALVHSNLLKKVPLPTPPQPPANQLGPPSSLQQRPILNQPQQQRPIPNDHHQPNQP